jgi:hypothetical protein
MAENRAKAFRNSLFSAMRSQEEDVKVNGAKHPGLLEPMQGILRDLLRQFDELLPDLGGAIPMILTCPACGGRHLDEGEFATKVHHTHACQHCGMVWRPAIVPTVGVQFLPGFKNESPDNV